MKKILCYTAVATLFSHAIVIGGEDVEYDSVSDYDFGRYNDENCKDLTTTTGAPSTENSNNNDDNSNNQYSKYYNDYTTNGQDYENRYKDYYSKYYNGGNGDSGYDNGNDSGPLREKMIMCICSNEAKDSKNSQDAFSKCVNREYGNNAANWENIWKKFRNMYETTTTTTTQAVFEGNNGMEVTGEGGIESGLSTTGLIGANGNGVENDLESGLSDSNNSGSNGGGSFTHSEYMSYLAIFLMFVGSILFILAGINCFRYTYKTYRLRAYDAIGESVQKTEELQNNKLKKHDRIRLPRRNGNKVDTMDDSNNNYNSNYSSKHSNRKNNNKNTNNKNNKNNNTSGNGSHETNYYNERAVYTIV